MKRSKIPALDSADGGVLGWLCWTLMTENERLAALDSATDGGVLGWLYSADEGVLGWLRWTLQTRGARLAVL